MRALWTDLSVEVRVLSGALGRSPAAGLLRSPVELHATVAAGSGPRGTNFGNSCGVIVDPEARDAASRLGLERNGLSLIARMDRAARLDLLATPTPVPQVDQTAVDWIKTSRVGRAVLSPTRSRAAVPIIGKCDRQRQAHRGALWWFSVRSTPRLQRRIASVPLQVSVSGRVRVGSQSMPLVAQKPLRSL